MATPLSNIAIKRILSDMKDLNRSPLEEEGIYHYYDESNMQNCKIMIIGPQDTPYENGFYLFQFTFPPNYPFEPPAVKYCTQGNNIRFNPNLYVCGKVCLSLINTWEGPKWTSCQTIRSVLISLRGLVLGVKYPLQNEPGFESATDTRAQGFNDVITHENYRTAVVQMMTNPPPGFDVFVPQMVDYVKRNYSAYEKNLTSLSKLDNTPAHSPVYNMNIQRNFSAQLSSIKSILVKHGFDFPQKTKNILVSEADYSDDEDELRMKTKLKEKEAAAKKLADEQAALLKAKEEASKKLAEEKAAKLKEKEEVAKKLAEEKVAKAKEKEEEKAAKAKDRKAPNEPAKNYEIGHTMVGQDGKTYVIKEVGTEGKKYKRWSLVSEQNKLHTIKIVTDGDDYTEIIVKDLHDVKQQEQIKIVTDGDDYTEIIVKNLDDVKQQENSEKVDSVESKTTEKKAASVRKAPNEPAKNYDNGYEMTSPFDNKVYVVKTVGTDAKQFKRWVLKK
jgi:ubiquitin-protein ligase